ALPLLPPLVSTPLSSCSHTLSLHDALPIFPRSRWPAPPGAGAAGSSRPRAVPARRSSSSDSCLHLQLQHLGGRILVRAQVGDRRSDEHTPELQSRFDLVCRLLLEKKNMHGH